MSSIRADLLAAKTGNPAFQKAAAAFPHIPAPKLKELLWFVQWQAAQPGGLECLVETLLTHYSERFITKEMAAAGPAKGGSYTLAQILEIWKREQRSGALWYRSDYSRYEAMATQIDEIPLTGNERKANLENYSEWLAIAIDGRITVKAVEKSYEYNKSHIQHGLEKFNYPFLHGRCLDEAREHLAGMLAESCNEGPQCLKWAGWCHDLPGLLLHHMEQHAAQTLATIGETAVTKIIRRELDFAMSEKVVVPFFGDTRCGKTSPVDVFCEAFPGRARLVTVPANGRERDFIEAHAKALCIEVSPGASLAKLSSLVKEVYLKSELFIIYDEFHRAFPWKFSKTTLPSRLEFIRDSIIDIKPKRGTAFFSTPQNYNHCLKQYVRTTSYNIGQWLGRLTRVVELPADLDLDGLMAIARNKFGDIPAPFLKLIAAKAMKHAGYIQAVEDTAKRARFIAREHGRATPNLDDVQAAIADMMPEERQAVSDTETESAGIRPLAVRPQPRRAAKAPRQTVPEPDQVAVETTGQRDVGQSILQTVV